MRSVRVLVQSLQKSIRGRPGEPPRLPLRVTSTSLDCRGVSLQGFKEGDEVADLVGIKAELRHGRVPGDDPFRERFL